MSRLDRVRDAPTSRLDLVRDAPTSRLDRVQDAPETPSPYGDSGSWLHQTAPAAPAAPRGEPNVSWPDALRGFSKLYDPYPGSRSLNLLTGTQTLEDQTPTEREIRSSNALLPGALLGGTIGALTAPGAVGMLPAIGLNVTAGGAARTIFDTVANDTPIDEAIVNAATDPIGVGVDAAFGGLGGWRTLLNSFKGATPATGGIAKVLTDAVGAADEGASIVSKAPEVFPGTNRPRPLGAPASEVPVPEIEKARLIQEGAETAVASHPREIKLRKNQEARKLRDQKKSELQKLKRQKADKGTIAAVEAELEQAEGRLKKLLSEDEYGAKITVTPEGQNVNVQREAARQSRQERARGTGVLGLLRGKLRGGRGQENSLNGNPSSMYSRVAGRLISPLRGMEVLEKRLEKQIANRLKKDPKADVRALESMRSVVGAGRQLTILSDHISKRVEGELLDKAEVIMARATPEDLVDSVSAEGKHQASRLFLALDGDEAVEKTLSEGSQAALKDLRELFKSAHGMNVRAGRLERIDLDHLRDLFLPENAETLNRIRVTEALTGVQILPQNLTLESVEALGKISNNTAFAERATELGLVSGAMQKEGGTWHGRTLLVPLLPKKNYVPHQRVALPEEAKARPEEYYRAENPHATSAEIDAMVHGGGNKTIFAHQRTGDDLTSIETNIPVLLEDFIRQESDLIGTVAAWGGREESAIRAGFGDYAGSLGNVPDSSQRIFHALPEGPQKEAFRLMLTRRMNMEVNQLSPVVRGITGTVSNMFLPYASITSMSELHKSLWSQGGVRGFIKGRARVSDIGYENVNRLYQRSGAAQAPVYEVISGVARSEMKKVSSDQRVLARLWQATSPMEAMRKAENFLREQGSYGNIDFIFTTARRAAEQLGERSNLPLSADLSKLGRSTGRRTKENPYSLRVLKEASEIFPAESSPRAAADRLATEFTATGGKISEDIYLEGIQHLTRRQFYTTAIGFVGDSFKSGVGAVATQYRPFMVKALDHFRADIVDPIVRGVQNPGSGLLTLGLTRLGTAVPTAFGTAAGSALTRSLVSGRMHFRTDEDFRADLERRIIDLWAGSLGGIGAEGGFASLELAGGKPQRFLDFFTSFPAESAIKGNIEDAVSVIGDAIDPDEDVKGSEAVRLLSNALAKKLPQGKVPANIIEQYFIDKEKQNSQGGRGRRRSRVD